MPKFLPYLAALAVIGCNANTSLANPLLNGLNRPLDRPQLENRLNTSPASEALSAREAVSIAERRYGGRAVGARRISTPRGPAYRVRILQDNGVIKNVIIDN